MDNNDEKHRLPFTPFEVPVNEKETSKAQTENEIELQAWEENHAKIREAISMFITVYHRLPTKTELASETKLSRQTITAYLEEFAQHPSYRQEIEHIRIMSTKVLTKVADLALQGNTDAAKLYIKLMSQSYPRSIQNDLVKNNFYFVKVNGFVLLQGLLDDLGQENVDIIENALKPAAEPEYEEGAPTNEASAGLARDRVWENNHHAIVNAISGFITLNKRVPTNTELAAETKLSRQTIGKHLEEFTKHPMYREEIEQFRSLTTNVLAAICAQATNGNVKAAKLYFQVVTDIYPHADHKALTHKSHLVVNRTSFNQEKMDRLSPEQRNIIHAIINDRSNYDPVYMKTPS